MVEEQTAGTTVTAALEAPIRRLLGRERATADTWQVVPLQNSFGGATGGIFRVEGSARAGGRTIPFALVLKVIRAPTGRLAGMPQITADPGGSHYWQREALAYQSGSLDDLPGLAAPHCYGIKEQADGALWLWLEAVRDDGGPVWPFDCYGTAARHLGQFNGAYLVGRPRPEYAWLSRRWLRDWIPLWSGMQDRSLVRQEEAWRTPLARIAFPEPVAEQTLRMWEDEAAFLAALDRLPQTLLHRDANRTNLFCRRRPGQPDETVAVDWAFMGSGAVGEDVVQVIVSTLWRGLVAPEAAEELSAVAWHGYLEGLREAGWQGDERLARLGYAASAVLRFGFFPGWVLQMATDAEQRARWEAPTGKPAEEIVASLGAASRLLLGLAAEARTLIAALD